MSELLIAAAAFAGGAFGVAADRLAARWPEHELGVTRRGFDWRTVVVGLAGAAVAGGLVARWDDPFDLAVVGVFAAVLLVLLATDLDQRLLPDVLALPLIGFAGGLLLIGGSPLLADRELVLVSALGAGIGAPAVLVISDRLLRGELGGGDVKLAAAIGLFAGVSRFLGGFLIASAAFGLVLLVLLITRRISRRTAVPFGPALIGAAWVAMLLP